MQCRLLLLGLLLSATMPGAAADPRPAQAALPPDYQLADVGLRVERQFGHGRPGSVLSLSGSGAATLTRDTLSQAFVLSEADLLKLLNQLYATRFFELPAQLRAPASVFVRKDGSVGTQVLKMADADSTAVCFSVPGFEKCVRHAGAGLRELDDWTRMLLEDAERRAATPGAGK